MFESEPGAKLEEPVIKEEESNDDSDTRGVDQAVQIPPLEEGPQLRRKIKERQPFTRYQSSEYILIADTGVLENFQ